MAFVTVTDAFVTVTDRRHHHIIYLDFSRACIPILHYLSDLGLVSYAGLQSDEVGYQPHP